MSPAEIDRYVRDRMVAGEDLYTLDAGAPAGLGPDLILTQDLCRVCALPSGDVAAALDYLGCRADVLSLDPHTLEEVLQTIDLVGQRAGAAERADQVLRALRVRLDAVAARVAGLPRPRVLVLEWVDPPFTAGHWIPDLVVAAGGEPVCSWPGEPSRPTGWGEIIDSWPDLVVVAACGYHLTGAVEQAATVAARLPEVPIWAIDGMTSSSVQARGWSTGSRRWPR